MDLGYCERAGADGLAIQQNRARTADTFGAPTLDGNQTSVFAQILERLSAGEPLAQICRSDGMPSAHTVRSWQVKREDVREAIAAAREAGEEVIASDCLAIADDGHNDWQEGKYGPMPNGEVVQRSKLRVWTRLQLLARWNPKKWAERQSHQMLDEHGR